MTENFEESKSIPLLSSLSASQDRTTENLPDEGNNIYSPLSILMYYDYII